MIRMSKLTDYAIVLLAHLARGGRTRTAQDLAERSRVPLPTVSKLCKELSKAGLVISHRGRHGGYGLARQAEAISVAEIVEALEGPKLRKRRRKLRAVYCTPHHQCPTTVSLAPGRRMALLELARRHGFAIVEDDYDHEFHYSGPPVLPLASADTAGVVVYVGTLSKVLAPALRLGFVVAPPDLVSRLVAYRSFVDLQGDPVLECAVAELLVDGLIQRHVRKVRRLYRARRDALAAELGRRLEGFLSFVKPSGGTAIWA